jgi:DGQHR domain-containing protein
MKTRGSITFPCIKVTQPIGSFYVGSISAEDLCEITWVDVRRIEGERGFETYLGIQRPLNLGRVRELSAYVKSPDACFPTSVILTVPAECTMYNDKTGLMTLSRYSNPDDASENIDLNQIAKVIDGQHRIEGLRESRDGKFEINVSIFVDMDIAEQAYLFSTVNLTQTKVNKSLVYDLFELAKTRSPQKTCHEMAVALDKLENSPFHQRIKRLGTATEGRFNETITQATFVQSVIEYISPNPMADRNLYLQGMKPKLANADQLRKFIFRNMFIQERDMEITDIIWNYFEAIKRKWPGAWNFYGSGLMLNKTNGFRAFMRFLRPAYLNLCAPGNVPSTNEFQAIVQRIGLNDDEFTTNIFKPGTSGESLLYRTLIEKSQIS